MADQDRHVTSLEQNSRKRSFTGLNTRRPGTAQYLPLHLDANPTFPEAPSESLNRNFPPPSRLQRYEGDGLDLRRPVMAQRMSPIRLDDFSDNVIDLTSDSESPQADARTGRAPISQARSQESRRLIPARTPEIIDISEEEEVEAATTHVQDRSPEVQFVSERPRLDTDRVRSRHNSPRLRAPPRAGWLHTNFGRQPERRDDSTFGTIHQYTRALLGRDRTDENDDQGDVFQFFSGLTRVIRPSIPGTDWLNGPGVMDFTTVGFDLTAPPPVREEVRPVAPEYEAPKASSEGFTRAPNGEDTCICPNCGNELGVGDEIQRQIWAIRQCGHVYCGTCIHGRKAKKRILSKCICEGCTSTIRSGKSWMFMLYI